MEERVFNSPINMFMDQLERLLSHPTYIFHRPVSTKRIKANGYRFFLRILEITMDKIAKVELVDDDLMLEAASKA